MSSIHDAIVEILTENSDVANWAEGGIHVRRAPQRVGSLRDRYIVVRLLESTPVHAQEGLATLTTDIIGVNVWAEGGRDAHEGANRVRKALDAVANRTQVIEAQGITIQRIFWRGSTDFEVENPAEAEQLIDGVRCEFEVSYTLP